MIAACTPAVPDSGAGVGFNDYTEFAQERAARDAELTGTTVLPPAGGQTVTPVQTTVSTPPSSNTAPLTAIAPNNAGISDEQDFSAVSERQSIESDAERIAQQRAQFQVIEPTALPTRANSGPNIVEYALSTTNSVGQSQFRRSSFSTTAKFVRNCAKYPSSDMAQLDFLGKGGPSKDRMGLDPDGDGFACAWDPTPFRAARATATAAVDSVITEAPLN